MHTHAQFHTRPGDCGAHRVKDFFTRTSEASRTKADVLA